MVRKLKSVNASTRNRSVSGFRSVTKSEPEKSLVRGLKKKSGRNNYGRITVRHHGGGHKRRYRLVDFKRDKKDISARVHSIEYDPNRTARIALICYADGFKSYILAPEGLKPKDQVISSDKGADIKPGNCMPLGLIPEGTAVHNIELRPGAGGKLARSAGVSAVVASHLKRRSADYSQLKMPSGEIRQALSLCRASVGSLGNAEQENIKWGKAGRSRWRGRRPGVRGMAMNPVDHPLGGGEGVSKGNHPMTPWGKSCKGLKTRSNRRTDKMIVHRRKKKGGR